MTKIQNQIKMKYCIVRFTAPKPDNYNGEELEGNGEIIYKRPLKSEIVEVLKQVFNHAKEKSFNIVDKTNGSYFICENKTTKYMFAIMDYKLNMRIVPSKF